MTEEHARNVCRVGKGAACCRYLLMTPRDGWRCGKLSDLRQTIDQRVESGEFTARGDNCEGVP